MTLTSAVAPGTHQIAVELGHAVHELVAHRIHVEEFARRFLVARVYTLAPVNPGLFVMTCPGGSTIVPVWSTVRALRRVMGGFDWLACTGGDVVAHLPEGVGVLVDDGMPCPVALPPSVLLQHRCGV